MPTNESLSLFLAAPTCIAFGCALALSSVGCSFSPPKASGSDLDGGQVPDMDGGQADASLADATPGADGNTDPDNDGVPVGVDNCPTEPNPDQANEDTDTHGDACDNCPTIANQDQANVGEVNAGQAADDLGDVCDPRAADSGDSIAFFDGFNGSSLQAGWGANGTWVVVGDGTIEQRDTTEAASRELFRTNTDLDTVVVETTIEPITRFGDDYSFGAITAALPLNGEVNSAYICALGDVPATAGPSLIMAIHRAVGLPTFLGGRDVSEPVPGTRYSARVYHREANDEIRCESGSESILVNNSDLGSGTVGVRTFSMTARVYSIIVYSLGGPL